MEALPKHGYITLPETNSEFAPENWWLDDEVSLWNEVCLFSGAMLVLGRVDVVKRHDVLQMLRYDIQVQQQIYT